MLLRCTALGLLFIVFVGTSVSGQERQPLSAEDLWKLHRVGIPSISPDGAWVAVDVTTYDVDKDDSTSQIWLLSTDGKHQRQLTQSPGKNQGPIWSSDGKWIAFTSKRADDDAPQIYRIAPDGGEAQRVSSMPFTPSGLKWAKDGKTIYCIAWTWPDTPDDESYRKKDKAHKESKRKAVIIDDAVYRYWDRWISDGRRPVVFAVDLRTGKHRNLLAGTGKTLPPYEPSSSDYDVSPDGKELCFVADNVKAIGTDANHDLYTLSLGGKAVLTNITEDNPANDHSPVYSPDGQSIAFLRQHIKYFYADRRQLMVHDRASGKKMSLTADLDRSCENPTWFPDSKRISFHAQDKGLVNRFVVDVPGGKPRTRPTGFSERNVAIASQAPIIAFVRNSFEMPPTIFAQKLGEEAATQISFFNDALLKQRTFGRVEERYFKGADDADVQMFIIYPPDFDPKKKWPLVQVVHGGPHNGIMNEFSFRWNLQVWAGRGYVIGCVNFHGSSGFGQRFCDSITGDYGTKPLIDIMKSTDWFEKQPWIDAKRTAAAGASYGGYMMAYINGHTDRFKALVCHAGVYSYHSQMASDIVLGRQRALGTFPWQDLAKIDKQSAQRYSGNFKTPTLVLHGEKDFRVPLTHGLEYYNTLKQKGIPTRLVYFPDENHWILKPQNSLLWHDQVFAWLEKYIGRGPTKE